MSVCGFTPWIIVPPDSGVSITANSVGREWRMRVVYKAGKVALESLQKCELKGLFITKEFRRVEMRVATGIVLI